MTPSRTLIPCPACGETVGLPAAALGKPLTCPQCGASFHVPHRAGGVPTLGLPPQRFAALPRGLIVPIFALLVLGTAGMFVDGYLSYRFATQPNAAQDYALGRAIEARSIVTTGNESVSVGDDWEYLPHAAAAGSAMTLVATPVLDEAADRALAKAWAPAVAAASLYSFAASALAFVGGLCILRGRFYWLAMLGCLAAIVNVNHLCCVPGGIAGVWGILSLVRDDGRLHFGIRPGG